MKATIVKLQGGSSDDVLVYDAEKDPVRGEFIHVDFYALDVFEFEPKISKGLLKLDNVVLTPHTASATEEARSKMAEVAAQNIIEALEGRVPPNLVVNR